MPWGCEGGALRCCCSLLQPVDLKTPLSRARCRRSFYRPRPSRTQTQPAHREPIGTSKRTEGCSAWSLLSSPEFSANGCSSLEPRCSRHALLHTWLRTPSKAVGQARSGRRSLFDWAEAAFNLPAAPFDRHHALGLERPARQKRMHFPPSLPTRLMGKLSSPGSNAISAFNS